MEVSDIISIVSIFISLFFTVFTLIRDKKRNEIVDKLNKLLLQKEIKEYQELNTADFNCRIDFLGNDGEYSIQLENCGKSTAYNVNVKIIEGDWNLDLEKFPYQIIQSKQYIDIYTRVFISSEFEKIKLCVIWQNEINGNEFSKQFEISC